MRNLVSIVFIFIFVSLVSSCQKVELLPNNNSSFISETFSNRTLNLSAPTNFIASNISEQNITFSWDGLEGEEGYLLKIYNKEGNLISTYSLEGNTRQHTVNMGEGSFKALLTRVCGENLVSSAAETAATACCGSISVPDDDTDIFIQNGHSTCLSDYTVESYTLNSTQSVTQLTHTIYSASPDYIVLYGFTNTQDGTPTTYNMIPMSNILTVNAATSMNHTLQLDFQGYSYCKVYFIPWNLNNCSVL